MERLISAYRKDDWADAKGFTVQLGAILENYPAEVVDYVSHPLTGIQRSCRFPPSLAEVVEACDKRLAAVKLEWALAESEARRQREWEEGAPQREAIYRKTVARCHLWMRAEPYRAHEVAKFSSDTQEAALRMSLDEALELCPEARKNFVKPIEQCKQYLNERVGGIVG